ncbi:hypothetical protein BHE74_00052609 [Ensete ventricosum]|nr:hypothetical protein BHE74_00052609 [Ensete ventricosum]
MGDLIMWRYNQELLGAPLRDTFRAAGELDCSSAYIRLTEPDKSKEKAEGVEAGGRKWRGSDDESRGVRYPKAVSTIMELDSKECNSATEAGLPIAKKGMPMQGNRE